MGDVGDVREASVETSPLRKARKVKRNKADLFKRRHCVCTAAPSYLGYYIGTKMAAHTTYQLHEQMKDFLQRVRRDDSCQYRSCMANSCLDYLSIQTRNSSVQG